jgi:hypothetical protein
MTVIGSSGSGGGGSEAAQVGAKEAPKATSDLKMVTKRTVMVTKASVGWVQMNKHLNVVMHIGHIKSPNLVASCVTELDDTLPPYGCYTG